MEIGNPSVSRRSIGNGSDHILWIDNNNRISHHKHLAQEFFRRGREEVDERADRMSLQQCASQKYEM